MYKSICECVKPKNVTSSLCRPTKKKIKEEEAGTADGSLTKEQLKTAIGNPQDLHFVKAKEHHFSCLDGRVKGEMMGTPGCDMGEFILALQSYENLIDRPLGQANVDSYLADLIKGWVAQGSTRKFYMCTDEAAVEKIKTEGLNMAEFSASTFSTADTGLLNLLGDAKYYGDAHLRWMMESPEKYGVRKELVQAAVTAYFKIMQGPEDAMPNRNHLKLEILGDGKRLDEKAFVDVATTKDCVEEGRVPMVNPATLGADSSMLMLNLQGVGILRNQISRFFAHKSGGMIDAQTMKRRLNHMGREWLEVTAKKLAGRGKTASGEKNNIPFFTVSRDRAPSNHMLLLYISSSRSHCTL